MATSVDLQGELEEFVEEEVKSGRYNSKSELLRQGVRMILMARKHRETTQKINKEGEKRLKKGVEDIKENRTKDWETVKEEQNLE